LGFVHIFDILIFYGSILANLGFTRGWPETGFFREYLVVIRRFGEKPGFFVGVGKFGAGGQKPGFYDNIGGDSQIWEKTRFLCRSASRTARVARNRVFMTILVVIRRFGKKPGFFVGVGKFCIR